VQPSPCLSYRIPRDFVDLSSGEDAYKLIDFLKLVSRCSGSARRANASLVLDHFDLRGYSSYTDFPGGGRSSSFTLNTPSTHLKVPFSSSSSLQFSSSSSLQFSSSSSYQTHHPLNRCDTGWELKGLKGNYFFVFSIWILNPCFSNMERKGNVIDHHQIGSD